MKIYLSHSSNYDYKNELYTPLKSSSIIQHQILFPHDKENIDTHSKDLIIHSDLVIAEVSYPSTGQGIELGWANNNGTPIICIYKRGMKISSSLRFITTGFIEYEDQDDMLNKLTIRLVASK
jgi:nucleoside 2-deoxyribosyltransferase